jgi:hypothetical protein
MADVAALDLFDLERYGRGTDRTVKKTFEAIEIVQRRSLTEQEKVHLLKEPFVPTSSKQKTYDKLPTSLEQKRPRR